MAAGDWPSALEQAFLAAIEAQIPTTFKTLVDHEPEKFAGNAFPAVSLFAVQAPDDDIETGPRTQTTWTWRVNLYCSIGKGYKEAQAQLKVLWPKLLRAIRVDPSLGIDGSWARLTDPGGEPEFNHDEKFIVKTLRLEIQTMEA